MPAPAVLSPAKVATAVNVSVPSPDKAPKAVLTEAPIIKKAVLSDVTIKAPKGTVVSISTEGAEPNTFLAGVSRAPCAPFLAGKCKSGEACPYNHNRDQIFGTSALDDPSPQGGTRQIKNKRQRDEMQDRENQSPNKAKKGDSAEKDCDQGSSPLKRARLLQSSPQTKQQWHQENGEEYWGEYEGDDQYWCDEYGLYDYGFGYDDSWDQSYGEYYECWAEEGY